jgi:hypothetical protein
MSETEKEQQRKQSESDGHEYAKYKWGSYIKHDIETNHKYIVN